VGEDNGALDQGFEMGGDGEGVGKPGLRDRDGAGAGIAGARIAGGEVGFGGCFERFFYGASFR